MSDAEDDGAEVVPVTQAIVGGFAANGPWLDAIGTVNYEKRTLIRTKFDLWPSTRICNGSLISQTAVLTTRACARTVMEHLARPDVQVPLGFHIGPERGKPSRNIRVVAAAEHPSEAIGGIADMGTNIGVVYLGEPVTDVQPVRLAQLGDDQLGQTLTAIGYGVAEPGELYPNQRRAGNVHVDARSGRLYERIFGSVEAFYRWHEDGAPPSDCDGQTIVTSSCQRMVELRRSYDAHQLGEHGEVLTARAPGDAWPCMHDEGGALVSVDANGLTLYGVYSTGMRTINGWDCTLGAVFTAFGPETLRFIDDALRFRDPCGGVPAYGMCDGAIERRCRVTASGKVEKQSFNCGLFGLACGLTAQDTINCILPGAP